MSQGKGFFSYIDYIEINELAINMANNRMIRLLLSSNLLSNNEHMARKIVTYLNLKQNFNSIYRKYRGQEIRLLFILGKDEDRYVESTIGMNIKTGEKYLIVGRNMSGFWEYYHLINNNKYSFNFDYEFDHKTKKLIDRKLVNKNPDFTLFPALASQVYSYLNARNIEDFCYKLFPTAKTTFGNKIVSFFTDIYKESKEEESEDDAFLDREDQCMLTYACYPDYKESIRKYKDRFYIERSNKMYLLKISEKEYRLFKRIQNNRSGTDNIFPESDMMNYDSDVDNNSSIDERRILEEKDKRVVGYVWYAELNFGKANVAIC